MILYVEMEIYIEFSGNLKDDCFVVVLVVVFEVKIGTKFLKVI